MVNPYFCYCLSFTTALLMYMLGWSDLYPALSFQLILFLAVTILAHILMGLRLRSTNVGGFAVLKCNTNVAPWIVTISLYLLWTAEFIYAGGVPLFKILMRQPYDYKLFGIPTLHVFIVTFGSFYAVYLLHLYLSQKQPHMLFLYLLNLIAAVLIYNRGMLLFNLSASGFLVVICRGQVTKKFLLWVVPSLLVLAFFFGVLGTLRVSHESRTVYTNVPFLQTGGASARFRNSGIPPEFFWTYIYATSPLANLQVNISSNDPPRLGLSTVGRWLNNEVLFDFISKRINRYGGNTPAIQKRIPGPFNACTIYSGSYSYFGWPGLILMATVILLLPLVLLRLLPVSSPFFLTGFVLMNTVFFFMIFENTLRFTGLSFQLVYPLLFTAGIRRFSLLRRIFSLQ